MAEGVRRVSPFLVPKMIPNLAAGNVSIRFKAKGPNMALSTACAAGAHAIGLAYRSIQMGEAELMAAGGTEAAVTILTISAFFRMGALAAGYNDHPEAASRPFDLKRCGFVMSEGSGILILEELEHALARNANIYAEIVGFGMTGDAHHITDPDKEGARRCILAAMKDGGVTSADIDYVNPHATATPVGDRNETWALKEIFGENASRLLVSGTKSMTGHLLGAAGAVESIFSSCPSGTEKCPRPSTWITWTRPVPGWISSRVRPVPPTSATSCPIPSDSAAPMRPWCSNAMKIEN